jgi:hypothetical protein
VHAPHHAGFSKFGEVATNTGGGSSGLAHQIANRHYAPFSHEAKYGLPAFSFVERAVAHISKLRKVAQVCQLT